MDAMSSPASDLCGAFLRFSAVLLVLTSTLCAQETVSLKTEDGFPLKGTLTRPATSGAARGGILLLHNARGDRRAFATQVKELSALGFLCLALDMRGHGESLLDANGKALPVDGPILNDPGKNPFFSMHRDAKAGLAMLVEKGAPAGSLGVVGAGAGASVALLTTIEHPTIVHALTLLSPGINACGLPSDLHAARIKDRPVFILASAEEGDLGPAKIAAASDPTTTRLKVLDERGVHGTTMFGRVPGIEAEIGEFFASALGQGPAWEIPWCRDVILDGAVESEEGLDAFRITVPMLEGPESTVRLTRDRKRLIVGVRIPERYVRRNEVTVYVDSDPKATVLSETSLKVSLSPADPERPPEQVSQGSKGAWADTTIDGVRSYANTRNRDRWEVEIAIPLSFLSEDEALGTSIRIGVRIRGQKEDAIVYLPDSRNLDQSPRTWHTARIASLK